MALYQEAQPDLIGPVRSIRPYFVEWAAGFDAGLAHVGGSELALKMVKSGDYVVDLDQFKAPEGIFWRSEDRVAPHNMYTKMSGLDKYMAKLDKKNLISKAGTDKRSSPIKQKVICQLLKPSDFQFLPVFLKSVIITIQPARPINVSKAVKHIKTEKRSNFTRCGYCHHGQSKVVRRW